MSKTIYINYYGAITEQNVNVFMRSVPHLINSEKADILYLVLSSSGGNVVAGLTMYNFILALKNQVEIIVHNIGSVDSIALVPFMAGDKRYSNPHTSFLLHEMTWTLNSATYTDAQLLDYIQRNKINSQKTSKIISSKSSLTEKQVINLYKKGESKDETFAKNKELVHDVKILEIPKDSFYYSLEFLAVPQY